MRTYLFLSAMAFIPILLSACVSQPEPTPAQTTLSLTIKAGFDINPSTTDQATPLQARLYELTDSTLCQQADFLSLYLEDTATLQSSLIKKHPLPTVHPGSSQTFSFQLDSATRFIAVLGEFSRYQGAVAHVTKAIVPGQNNGLILDINDNHLRLIPVSYQAAPGKGKANGS